ncbi:MAG: DUF983 domain-containing protein [Flavobacteriales bacterium]|nr:DUF983 domain-containing protein [Flavobacteriales bacterium]
MQRGFIYSVVKDKCPRCNEGNLFVNKNWYTAKNIGVMPDNCPVCGQDFKIEDGFYLGATYVSYAITVALLVPLLAISYFLFNLDFMWLLPILVVLLTLLMPPILRVSRSIWINFFVHYNPEWKKIDEEYLLKH